MAKEWFYFSLLKLLLVWSSLSFSCPKWLSENHIYNVCPEGKGISHMPEMLDLYPVFLFQVFLQHSRRWNKRSLNSCGEEQICKPMHVSCVQNMCQLWESDLLIISLGWECLWCCLIDIAFLCCTQKCGHFSTIRLEEEEERWTCILMLSQAASHQKAQQWTGTRTRLTIYLKKGNSPELLLALTEALILIVCF